MINELFCHALHSTASQTSWKKRSLGLWLMWGVAEACYGFRAGNFLIQQNAMQKVFGARRATENIMIL